MRGCTISVVLTMLAASAMAQTTGHSVSAWTDRELKETWVQCMTIASAPSSCRLDLPGAEFLLLRRRDERPPACSRDVSIGYAAGFEKCAAVRAEMYVRWDARLTQANTPMPASPSATDYQKWLRGMLGN